jgi:hypothetical protein
VRNTCTAYRLDRLDELNLLAPAASSVGVAVSGNAADSSVYLDSSCTIASGTLTILGNQASLTFYFKKATAGTVPLSFATTTSPSLTSITKNVAVSTGIASVLTFSAGATTIRRSTCSAYTLQTIDEAGLARNVTAATTVSLTDGASGNFYSDAACTTKASSFVLTSGTSSKVIYYSRLATGVVTLTAASTGFSPATRAVTVTTGLPAKVKVSAGASTVAVNSCTPYELSLYDAADSLVAATTNATLEVASNLPTMGLYSDDTCTAAASTIFMPTGSLKELVFAKASTAGQSGTISVSSVGLTGSSYAIGTTP